MKYDTARSCGYRSILGMVQIYLRFVYGIYTAAVGAAVPPVLGGPSGFFPP